MTKTGPYIWEYVLGTNHKANDQNYSPKAVPVLDSQSYRDKLGSIKTRKITQPKRTDIIKQQGKKLVVKKEAQ